MPKHKEHTSSKISGRIFIPSCDRKKENIKNEIQIGVEIQNSNLSAVVYTVVYTAAAAGIYRGIYRGIYWHIGIYRSYIPVLTRAAIILDYGLGLHIGLKDLPTLRTRIHCQILTEVKTFSFYRSTFLTGGGGCISAVLRDAHFLALCSSSVRKTMFAKATATAAWDWNDPKANGQAPGPYPISEPHPVPPSPPHDPHQLPPHGSKARWKRRVGKEGMENTLPPRRVRKSHCHVFLGGLDLGQAPP